MNYQVLARKWRPKSFETLVGQPHVVQALSNGLKTGRLHHAYLLTGTRGVGKTTIARILAKALNCETGVTPTPCGVCSVCLQIDAGRFVDLLEIDAASNTGIDNIREVIENARYAPTAGRFKVYLVDEVHMLSKAAFNALLKTLEEPPPHVKFILATTDPQKVPVTVLSRCLQFALRQMTPQTIAAHLNFILNEENIAFEPAALTLLGHAASGSMRDALSLLDQAIAYGNGHIQTEAVEAMLGVTHQGGLLILLRALAEKNAPKLLEEAQHQLIQGCSVDALLADAATLLSRVAIFQLVPSAIAQDDPEYSHLAELATLFSPSAIQLFYQILIHGRKELPLAPDEWAGFSMTLLRLLAFEPVGSGQSYGASLEKSKIAPVSPSGAPPSSLHAEPLPTSIHLPASTQAVPVPLGLIENWTHLVSALQIRGGPAKMLADNALLIKQEGAVLFLQLQNQHKYLAGTLYQTKLAEVLTQYFGQKITLQIWFAEESLPHSRPLSSQAETPAQVAEREKQQRKEAAVKAIEEDPFIEAITTDLGASVLYDTIQPRDHSLQ